MTLFLLLSLPLFAALVLSFWNQPLKDLKYMILSAVTGMLTFLVATLVALMWVRSLKPQASFFSRYGYLLFSYHGIFMVLGGVGAALIHLKKTINGGADDHFRELFLHFSGFFWGFNLQMAILSENWYGSAELFWFPLLSLSAASLCALLFNRFLGECGRERFLWLGLYVATALILPLLVLPSWYKTGFLTPLLTLLFTGGALFVLIREIRGDLPGSGVSFQGR